MIKSIQLSGVHSQLTKEEKSYVRKKIGGLDKYIPKDAHESVQAEVKIKEKKSKDKQIYECEVILNLPKATLTAHEKASSPLAAIDIVENNLKNQIKKYKDTHGNARLHRRVIARFKRQQS